jgi:hypothetical protein
MNAVWGAQFREFFVMAIGNAQMKRMSGMLCFLTPQAAIDGMEAVEAAGYQRNVLHDWIDDESNAVFAEAWRDVPDDADEFEVGGTILDELSTIVVRFRGTADDVGVWDDSDRVPR